MSSPSPSPYQSRLFTFLNRQFLRLGDRLQTTTRQIKVAAVLGVQLLIYPLYWLVQLGRGAGHQFQPADRQTPLSSASSQANDQPSVPPADAPLQQTFKLVEPWLSQTHFSTSLALVEHKHRELSITAKGTQDSQEVKNNTLNQHGRAKNLALAANEGAKAPARSRQKIRGIATHLKTRRLVLVSADNQILDLLTRRQQRQLRVRIDQALNRYWQQRQCAEQFFQDSQALPTGSVEKFTHWLKTSPIAKLLHRLEASQLVRASAQALPDLENEKAFPHSTEQQKQGFPVLDAFVSVLDRASAHLEAQPLVRKASDRLQQWRQPSTPSNSACPPPDSQSSNPLAIGALIRAAVDYFFANVRQISLHAGSPASGSFPRLKSRILSKLLPARAAEPANLAKTEAKSSGLVSEQEFSSSTLSSQTKRGLWASLSHFLSTTANRFIRQQETSSSTRSTQEVGEDPFTITALLRAALDYFFGQSRRPSLAGEPQVSASFPNPPAPVKAHLTATSDLDSDPWLTWEDLFTSPAAVASAPLQPAPSGGESIAVSLPQAPRTPDQRELSRLEAIKRKLQATSHSQLVLKSPTVAGKVTDTSPNHAASVPTQSSHVGDGESPDPEAQSDYLEAEATAVGYIKHPLEQLLAWLDRILLWLEEWVLKLWRAIARKH